MKNYVKGLKSGIPIALGYLSVSFSFGIMAVSSGLFWWQAILISMTNLTSAGQLGGLAVMLTPGQYLQMFVSQLTINIRYSFMSLSLSQKTDSKFSGIKRWLAGFFITDEIYAVAVAEENLTTRFFAGLSTLPYFGWALGTALGALLGQILPDRVMSALGVALYAMFVAIVIPEAKKAKPVMFVAIIAMILSLVFYYVPFVNQVPGAFAICICAIIAAVLGAIFFPIKEEKVENRG